jgi:hypothetical protein
METFDKGHLLISNQWSDSPKNWFLAYLYMTTTFHISFSESTIFLSKPIALHFFLSHFAYSLGVHGIGMHGAGVHWTGMHGVSIHDTGY